MTAEPIVHRRPPKLKHVYRGVQLQATTGATRFSLTQIRTAVEAAVTKNADVLAGRK